ncbi:MAG: hypothetical protein MZU97_26465 [Bacillus subtilis]|nr:hypothetical protein [Bacillus subtilis]
MSGIDVYELIYIKAYRDAYTPHPSGSTNPFKLPHAGRPGIRAFPTHAFVEVLYENRATHRLLFSL